VVARFEQTFTEMADTYIRPFHHCQEISNGFTLEERFSEARL